MITNKPKTIIISSKYLSDEDIHELWKIVGRLHDSPDFPIYAPEDAGIYPSPDNDAILENLFEDALEVVTRKNKYQFPPCTEEELNSTASELAKQWLEELPEPGDYDD